jgi:hypothetical protein
MSMESPTGPSLYQANGFLLWLLGPSVAASKALGLIAFAAMPGVTFIVLRRSGATSLEALTLAAAQCFIQAAFSDQALAFGVSLVVVSLTWR